LTEKTNSLVITIIPLSKSVFVAVGSIIREADDKGQHPYNPLGAGGAGMVGFVQVANN